MHSLTALSVLALFAAPLIEAHYTFTRLLVNGVAQGNEWEYVRLHQRAYFPTTPADAASSPDFRCNLGAGSGASTSVYTVRPGDRVGLLQGNGAGGMLHPGPVQIYMSRAPNGVKNYDGSGEWFKVYESLLCSQGKETLRNTAWCSWGENNLSFVMPTLPDGEYLVRGEHVPLHKGFNGEAEFYYACGQVKLVGGRGTTIPGDKVRIPGVYRVNDPALHSNLYVPTTWPYRLGPPVIPGGQIRGNNDGSSGATRVVAGNEAPPPSNPNPPPSNPNPPPSGSVPKFGQCGGNGWTGATRCEAGSTCQVSNPYYSQCL